jgi:hypothetical protein
VVVAAGAAERQAQERGAGRVGGVGQPLVFELAGDHRRLGEGRPRAIQGAGQDRLGVVGPELVAGDLLAEEAVERLVGVERLDHVVAVAPGARRQVVGLEPARVGVTDDVQPVASPALAILGRGQQPVDQPLISPGPIVVRESLDLPGRRQAHQVEVDATQQGEPAGLRRGGQALLLKPSEHEGIDRVADPRLTPGPRRVRRARAGDRLGARPREARQAGQDEARRPEEKPPR